jgi:hypothetical protein
MVRERENPDVEDIRAKRKNLQKENKEEYNQFSGSRQGAGAKNSIFFLCVYSG